MGPPKRLECEDPLLLPGQRGLPRQVRFQCASRAANVRAGACCSPLELVPAPVAPDCHATPHTSHHACPNRLPQPPCSKAAQGAVNLMREALAEAVRSGGFCRCCRCRGPCHLRLPLLGVPAGRC